MAIRDKAKRAAYMKTYMKERRRLQREEKAAAAAVVPIIPPLSDDPIGDLVRWSREKLVVPPGHPLAGEPMVLPDFGVAFLRDAMTHREAFLCIGRKNAKSAIVAVFLLGRLAGPLRIPGYRAGVCSVSKEKANELKLQMEAIATASGLDGLRFYRSPAPGRVQSASGTVEILSADKSAGHSSGFDESIVDEIGLLKEKDRELINGMRSAISAKDGRFIALSIQGDAPFTAEMIERRDEPGIAVHHYAPEPDCDLDDEAAWRAANPGLGTIKALSYMRDEAARVMATPADQASFKAYDLNLPQDPSREMICSLADWKACMVPADKLPPRAGPCTVGFDLGGSTSMTALVAYWEETGRMEAWGAFPATPDLARRGQNDAVGRLYERMRDRGELAVYAGRIVPVGAFLKDCAARLAGEFIVTAGADRFRKAEAQQAVADAEVNWPMVWRGQGASAVADGSHDVRAFNVGVLTGKIRMIDNLLLTFAIAQSSIRRDPVGNPALAKWRRKSRIDVLSAAVIAAGLSKRKATSFTFEGAEDAPTNQPSNASFG